MSQVFSGDSVNMAASVSLPTGAETVAVTGNFLNPPFQNAKAIVSGFVQVALGTGTTSVTIRFRRNPNAENFQIGGAGSVTVTAATNGVFSFQVADSIPDGRPVQYALTFQPAAATGAGTILGGNVTTFLISG